MRPRAAGNSHRQYGEKKGPYSKVNELFHFSIFLYAINGFRQVDSEACSLQEIISPVFIEKALSSQNGCPI